MGTQSDDKTNLSSAFDILFPRWHRSYLVSGTTRSLSLSNPDSTLYI
jgi:hypothetical protein